MTNCHFRTTKGTSWQSTVNDDIPQCCGSKAELGGALAVAWQRRVSQSDQLLRGFTIVDGCHLRRRTPALLVIQKETIEMQFSRN